MKKFLAILLAILSLSANAAAMEVERENLICALAVAAANEDETGDLVRRYFEARGYEVEITGAQVCIIGTDFKIFPIAAVSEKLIEYVKNHADEKIYLTGSAEALDVAIRLADDGADLQNVKLVTFGAPAVSYDAKINLTRLELPKTEKISPYLELALKNFYDAGLKINSPSKITTPIYIAPLKIVRKSFTAADEKYVRAILRDGYESRFTNATFSDLPPTEIKKAAEFSYDVREYVNAAKLSGCKFIIAPLIYTKSVRDAEQRTVKIVLEEIICDADGHLISMNTAGMTNAEVTILDAVFFVQEFRREDREKTLAQK